MCVCQLKLKFKNLQKTAVALWTVLLGPKYPIMAEVILFINVCSFTASILFILSDRPYRRTTSKLIKLRIRTFGAWCVGSLTFRLCV